MPGAFSVYNALAALTAARVLGAGEDAIHAGLAGAVVCGRVEPVPLDAPFTVVIDYAHNEAAAECLLRTLRAYRPSGLSRCSAAAARAAACASSAWGRSAHGWRISASSPRITAAASPWSTF